MGIEPGTLQVGKNSSCDTRSPPIEADTSVTAAPLQRLLSCRARDNRGPESRPGPGADGGAGDKRSEAGPRVSEAVHAPVTHTR